MKIVTVGKEDKELNQEWDNYIIAQSLPGHALSGWHNILEDIYQRTVVRLCIKNENIDITGFCFGYHDQANDMLYTPRFGLYADNEETINVLYGALADYCEERNIANALLTTGQKNFNLPRSWDKANMMIPLAVESEDVLWGNVPKKTRNMVRKAEKSALEIQRGWDALDGFYDVYQRRFLEKSLGLKPRRFFETLPQTFGEDVQLITVQKENQVVGGMIFLQTEKAVTYLYNASDHQATRDGGNNALMWEAMRYYHARGASFIELGESTIDGPVYNFKKRLSKNIEHVPVFYSHFFKEQATPSIESRLKGKINALEQKVISWAPQSMRQKYLGKQGQQGRVI